MQRRPSEARSKTTTEGAPPLGRYHDVGGRRLLLHRSGSGSPAVVFLAGGGTVGLDYLNVQERAAEFTTSVLYDRAGTGWSDRARLPRSSAEVTDELRELLHTAGVPAPYLLVGHSLGGFYARHYAQRFPDEVAGLLLLDPAHEDYNAYMPQQLVEIWNAWDPDQALPDELPDELIQLYRGMFAQEMADWPAEIREPLIEYHVSLEGLKAGAQEASNVDRLNDELRQAGMPDVPLIVLTAVGIDSFKRAVSHGTPESLLHEEIEGKRRLYTALAESVSRGENRLIDDAGHVTITFRRPDAVLQAIRDLLGR
ncbi:alpha/beta fold hydrolase [Actinomadura alba]|uniref:Alpha/beta hydrolase n=1 Tax=Actinomadura alba TaxID=406431 RepID=A0ABR7LWW8_9ACTN|nr:alpha/beta hydrolase [Actinomadura alba]MBC6469269.1 alpha/beta hydrolase [Actinomadura alba]